MHCYNKFAAYMYKSITCLTNLNVINNKNFNNIEYKIIKQMLNLTAI